MWVITEHGFYSAVEHRADPKKVMVRARTRGHIEALIDLCEWAGLEAEHTPAADYAWRVVMGKEDWANVVADMANAIDYDNFKSAAEHDGAASARTPDGRAYCRFLHAVWFEGFQMQNTGGR